MVEVETIVLPPCTVVEVKVIVVGICRMLVVLGIILPANNCVYVKVIGFAAPATVEML